MDYFKPAYDTFGNQPEETCKQKLRIFDDFKTKINKLNLDFDTKHQSITDQIKKLTTITDEVESVHKNKTVGSLKRATVGAVGGITFIVGLALAPVTAGVSLFLTIGGGVVGAAGGAIGTMYNTNNTPEKCLRQTIEKITGDIQNTLNTMLQILNTIINSTEDIQQLVQQDTNYYIPARMIQGEADKVRDISANLELPKAEMSQKSEVGKQFDKAVCWIKNASNACTLWSGTVKNVNLTSKNVKFVKVSVQTAKATRLAVAASGVISALFVVVDVYCIVQNSKEIHEMNKSADKRNPKNIKSNALKFIHQMRETAAYFQKTLDEIKVERDTAMKEFNRELKSGTSFLVRQKDRGNSNALIILSIVLVSMFLLFLIL